MDPEAASRHTEAEPRGLPPWTIRLYVVSSFLLLLLSVAVVPGPFEQVLIDLAITALLAFGVWRGSKLGWTVAVVLGVVVLGLSLARLSGEDPGSPMYLLGAVDSFIALLLLGAPASRQWVWERRPATD